MRTIHIDGASAGQPGPSGIGVFVKHDDGSVEEFSRPLGCMTNNEAEFEACVYAYELCRERGWHSASIRTDSQLVNASVEKRFVKRKLYQPYLTKILRAEEELPLCFLKWVPSRENRAADRLARQAVLASGRDSQY